MLPSSVNDTETFNVLASFESSNQPQIKKNIKKVTSISIADHLAQSFPTSFTAHKYLKLNRVLFTKAPQSCRTHHRKQFWFKIYVCVCISTHEFGTQDAFAALRSKGPDASFPSENSNIFQCYFLKINYNITFTTHH